jgi:hypothetical protein
MRSGQFRASGVAAGLMLSVHPCTESNRHPLARLSLPDIAPDDAFSQPRSRPTNHGAVRPFQGRSGHGTLIQRHRECGAATLVKRGDGEESSAEL